MSRTSKKIGTSWEGAVGLDVMENENIQEMPRGRGPWGLIGAALLSTLIWLVLIDIAHGWIGSL